MKLFSIFRLRRFLRAIERIAAAQESIAAIETARWERDSGLARRRRAPRPTEISSFDTEAANKSWREEQETAAGERIDG